LHTRIRLLLDAFETNFLKNGLIYLPTFFVIKVEAKSSSEMPNFYHVTTSGRLYNEHWQENYKTQIYIAYVPYPTICAHPINS
jgi:hypothetical protein